MNHRQSATAIRRPRLSRLARGIIIATEAAIRRVLSELKGTSTRIVGLSRGKKCECTLHCRVVGQGGLHVPRPLTIDVLPDDVLLEIFDYDRLLALKSWSHRQLQTPWNWQRLAHVRQGWRSLVFASPRRLQLRLYYTGRKPVTENLRCWPPSLPIAVWYHPAATSPPLSPNDEGNFFAILEHRDRICEINLAMTPALFERSTLRQGPFPALEQLRLKPPDLADRPLLLPATFLGPSVPRLRDIQLVGVAFPTLPHFLLSTRDLASLQLINIPSSDSFSAEILVNHLPVLTQLKFFEIRFDSWTHVNGPLLLASVTPDYGVLQSLTEFRFKGVCEYLEYLAARLDAPFLKRFSIEFFDRPPFDIPKLAQFIGRTDGLGSPRQATIELTVSDIAIVQQFQESSCRLRIGFGISCCALSRRVYSLSNICRHLLPRLSNVEQLDIKAFYFSSSASRPHEQMVDSTQWLELFRSFPGVKALGVSGVLVRNIASALERAARGEAAKDTFPALCDLRFNGTREYMSEIIESFVAVRRPSDRRPGSAHRIRREG